MRKEHTGLDPTVSVLVLGMHRSGTSALASALVAAGVGFGPPAGAMAPRLDNPSGFVERSEFVDLDEELLRTLGWTWDAPSAAALAEPPDRPGLAARGRALIQETLDDCAPWLIKDPRMSLLLPWWRRILLDRFVAVVPWRPIDEIAWSLHLRDGFPLALGVALSATYLRHLAAGLQGLSVITVDYPALTERPATVVPRLLGALREAGIRTNSDEQAPIAAIDPTLRRVSKPIDPSIDGLLSPETAALLASWPRGEVQLIHRWTYQPNQAAQWERALLEAQRRLRMAHQANAELRRQTGELQAELDRLRSAD